MQRNSMAERIRLVVERQFRLLGANTDQPLREKILIRDGTYCGHRFHRDGFQAVWFIEENELKIYGDGQVKQILVPVRALRREAA